RRGLELLERRYSGVGTIRLSMNLESLSCKGSRIFRSTVGVNEPMHILHVVGARPNFMKAPMLRALQNRGVKQTLVHTGQHSMTETCRMFSSYNWTFQSRTSTLT